MKTEPTSYAVFLFPQAIETLGAVIHPYVTDAPVGPHIVCSEVDTAGPAHLAQVRTSNVILEINRRAVHSEAEYHAVLSTLTAGEPVALLVYDKYSGARVLRTVVTDTEP